MTSVLRHSDWLNGRVPDAVRAHVRQLVEVVGYLPHRQPLGVLTADSVLLAANRPFFDLLGASDDEQLGADWDDFMPGWSERTGDARHTSQPRTLAFEDYLLPESGDPVWVKVVACPVFTPGAGGEDEEALAAWALFVVDDSPGESDRDERRRGAILELLLESPSEFVVQLGPDGDVEYLSPSLRRALGIFGDGLEGRPLATVHSLVEGDFAQAYPRLMDELRSPPYRAELEMTMATGGATHSVHWCFESLLADGGAVLGVLGVGRDVTERCRAESERAQSELRLRTLVEATSQLTWTTGPGGVIDRPMESWASFTGQAEGETVGDGWLDAVHPDDRERVSAAWAAAVAARGGYTCEYRVRAADGSYRWIEAHAVPLPGGSGEPCYFGVGQDISERKQAEESTRRRLELESMAAAVSTRLARTTIEDASLAVDFALAESGQCLGADRVSLYEFGPDAMRLSRVRTWRRETGVAEDGDASASVERLQWLRDRAFEGVPMILHSVDDLPAEAVAEREVFTRMGLSAILAVPVLHEPVLLGVLAYGIESGVHDDDPGAERRWSDDDHAVVRLITDKLAGHLVWRADELNLRAVADSFLAFGPEVKENLAHICHAAAKVTAAEVVLYSRRHGGQIVLETGWNVPEHLPWATAADGRIDADVLAQPDEQVRVVRDLQDTIYAHTSPVVARTGARTYAGFPVLVAGRAVATLSCLFAADVTLRDSQLELLRVLGRAAAVEEERRRAIEDRVLGLAQLEQAMERTVGTLSGAMGTRDPYTTGHERRVGELVVAIGEELGMPADDLRLLRLAATVHDIGKISIPAEILSKPTRLSEAEFALIRAHSEAGWGLLEPAGLPASVTDAVLQHHERLDGSGYPGGLKDGEIGEFARILAVADVVEAMSSDRPYRPAIGVEPALQEIEEGRGGRYDDRVADACLRLFREKAFAFSE